MSSFYLNSPAVQNDKYTREEQPQSEVADGTVLVDAFRTLCIGQGYTPPVDAFRTLRIDQAQCSSRCVSYAMHWSGALSLLLRFVS